MFQTLRQICIDQNINIEDFWNDDVVMSKNHEKVLKDLKYKVDWERKTSAMLKRIRMLVKDQSLSVRQRHMIRKLVINAKNNKTKLVMKDIACMFPGKSIKTLECCQEFYENKYS